MSDAREPYPEPITTAASNTNDSHLLDSFYELALKLSESLGSPNSLKGIATAGLLTAEADGLLILMKEDDDLVMQTHAFQNRQLDELLSSEQHRRSTNIVPLVQDLLHYPGIQVLNRRQLFNYLHRILHTESKFVKHLHELFTESGAVLVLPLQEHSEMHIIGLLVILYFQDMPDVRLGKSVAQQTALAIVKAGMIAATREARATQREILEAVNVGVVVTNIDQRVQIINHKLSEILGEDLSRASGHITRMELFERTKHLFLQSDALKEQLKRIHNHPEESTEGELTTTAGQTLFYYTRPIYVSSGKLVGHLEIYRDVTEEHRDRRRLRSALRRSNELAAENARLYKEQLSISESLQRSILPTQLPEVEGIEIATYYSSATSNAEIGGDFYDFLLLSEDMLAFVIGDVSGHGVDAAQYSAFTRHVIRTFAREDPTPSVVLSRANTACYKEFGRGNFVTSVYALYDRDAGSIHFANAGHPSPALVTRHGARLLGEGSGPALGIFPENVWPSDTIRLSPGDSFFTCTDGLLETRPANSSITFGQDRLLSSLRSSAELTASDLVDIAVEAGLSYSNNNLEDDLAVLVLRQEEDVRDIS